MEYMDDPIEINLTPADLLKGFLALTMAGFLTGWIGGTAAFTTAGAERTEMPAALAFLPLPSSQEMVSPPLSPPTRRR